VSEDRPTTSRTVRLPFNFGDRVYLRGREQRTAGTVIGFTIHPRDTLVEVRWLDDMEITSNHVFELSTEYEFEAP
jgi:hypothetical protein